MLLTAIAFSNFRISIRAVGHEMEKQYKKLWIWSMPNKQTWWFLQVTLSTA